MVHDERAARARPAPSEAGQHAALIGRGFSEIDLRRVRRYLRLAAVIPPLLLMAVPPLVAWFLLRIFDLEIGAAWTIVPTVLLIIGGAGLFLKSELGLRGYYFLLAQDAMVYEFGRSRTFLDLEQVQIVDSEASLPLRIFGLCRLSLHTAGGIVSVSPLPVWVPPAVEERVHQLTPAASRAS